MEKQTVDIYNGDEKVFTFEIPETQGMEAKKQKVVEFFQQPIFFQVVNSLNKFYKDKFDIQLPEYFQRDVNDEVVSAQTEISVAVIIKFDEINITNSLNHTALLKDMFVKFDIIFNKHGECKFTQPYLYGVRSTMYAYEVYTGYIHSHLGVRSRQLPTFNGFCLGSGPISMVLIELHNYDKFKIIKFEGFLYQLKNYLSWESIEGGPYIKISQRKKKENSNLPFYSNSFYNGNSSIFISLFINKYLEQFIKYTKISFLNNKKDIAVDILPSDEEKLIGFLKPILKENNIQERYLFAIKTETGYTAIDSSTASFNSKSLDNKPMFIFKNEPVKFKVIYEEEQDLQMLQKTILNPIFKIKMINHIKYLIKQKIEDDRNKNNGKISSEKKNGYYRFKEQESSSIYF